MCASNIINLSGNSATVGKSDYFHRTSPPLPLKGSASFANWGVLVVLLTKLSVVVASTTTPGDTVSPAGFSSFDDMESAIESIAGISISNQNATDHVFFVDSNLIAISNFTMEISTATPATQKKRWSDGDSQLGATWMEYQTPQQGTWWGDWQPASCVHPNTHGDLPVTVSLTRNVSHRGTWKPGFNLDFGKSSSLHSGHETVKLNTVSEMAWYAIPAYGYGQAWSQQLMVWQDQQRRSCKMEHYGPGGVTCGEWSDFFRGDLPVKNGVNFAWFTDWKKLDFNSCGGGT